MNYPHLTADERYPNELQREGFSTALIAKKLRRSPSTLFRELKRNKGDRGWRPHQAQVKAQARLSKRGLANVKWVNESAWSYGKSLFRIFLKIVKLKA